MSLLGESTSLFIDEGDGLTSERESVRMLVSLAVNAVGYKMIVGAYNTVDVRRIWEVLPCCTRYGKCRRPQHCGCPDACGGPYRVAPGMVNDGAHNTVDAQMHVGGLTMLAWYEF